MKKEQNNEEKKQQENEEVEIKKGFFKKVWYSIDKIEKYSELSAEGLKRAIKYLVILVMILAIISSIVTVYKSSLEVKNIAQYINEKAPEFNYSNEVLNVESQEPIIDDSTDFGKIIIDTNTEDEQKINEYLNDKQQETTILILKDKLILKEIGIQQEQIYKYNDLFGEMGISEFNKQELVNFLSSSKMITLYFNLFLALVIYAFIIYLINTIFNVLLIGILGYFTSLLLRLRIRFVAIFNMAVYSITLPTILNMVYIGINAFFNYNIKYFDIMYMLVASIYIIAAIFILKAEFNKKQGEVQKIVEVQDKLKEEIKKEDEKNSEEEKKEENKETGKKDKKEKTDEDDTKGEEPEGSNA